METSGRPLYQFHDFQILDVDDRPTGVVDWIWTDDGRGGEAFLGVHLQWLRGVARVVPAQGACVDVQARTIRVAYTREHIVTARRFTINRALSAADKQVVVAHYARDARGRASAALPPAVPGRPTRVVMTIGSRNDQEVA